MSANSFFVTSLLTIVDSEVNVADAHVTLFSIGKRLLKISVLCCLGRGIVAILELPLFRYSRAYICCRGIWII